MPTENRSSNTEMVSVPFQREGRYIVIKVSDLAIVPAAVGEPFAEQLTAIQRRLPERECLVIESDWPEYGPAWASIEARATGKPTQHQGEPVAWRFQTHAGGTWYLVTFETAARAFECNGEGGMVQPLYTHADPGEVERLRQKEAHLVAANRLLMNDCDTLRAQLADLKRRHDGLHRDMATIAGREVPKGCTVADYAAAAIADAISASAEPSAPVERAGGDHG